MSKNKKDVLVVGGGFSGMFAMYELQEIFNVTVVDCKEFFEFTPGILRAFGNPAHFDSLTFQYKKIFKTTKSSFLWGEVTEINGEEKFAKIKIFEDQNLLKLRFDFCVISAGCTFGLFKKWGESLWFPTVHERAVKESDWPKFDERTIEGRKKHIEEENLKLKDLNRKKGQVLVVGAGFTGVEWATELQHFFPLLKITLCDSNPRCLHYLPKSASKYCQKYMESVGIKTVYNTRYNPEDKNFLKSVNLERHPDVTYVSVGVKPSAYFVPESCKTEKGWINVNKFLQVVRKSHDGYETLWGDGSIFAVGDCATVQGLAAVPKVSYSSEEQAQHACHNLKVLNYLKSGENGIYRWCGLGPAIRKLRETWWPWGAGMSVTSLGPNRACFVVGVNSQPNSGYTIWTGRLSAFQKNLIEKTKMSELKNSLFGKAFWYFVHHTPLVN